MLSNIEEKVDSEVESDIEIDEDRVYTTGQVARIYKVSPGTVGKWFDSGKLKGFRIPGFEDRRIPGKYLAEFVKKHGIKKTKKFYFTGQVGKILKISQRTVIRCFDAGEFKGSSKIPYSSHRRISHESLIKFAQKYELMEQVEDYFGRPAQDL